MEVIRIPRLNCSRLATPRDPWALFQKKLESARGPYGPQGIVMKSLLIPCVATEGADRVRHLTENRSHSIASSELPGTPFWNL